MCGLTGIINIKKNSIDPLIIKRMTDVQKHRGPDDQGVMAFSLESAMYEDITHESTLSTENLNGAVGFNRLSILDLSANGHQPMLSSNKKVIIVFNGEVYNAFDFKPDLESRGYIFKSNTDTEVILNLYIEYGIDGLLERLNGMFAFSIIDLEKNKVFIARDHFGIKPLYYHKTDDLFMFSSEIKSFIEHPDFEAKIDETKIDEYVLFRYNAFDRTLFQGVKQLPPAHYLEYTENNFLIKEYWKPTIKSIDISEKEAVEKLDILLKQSVKSQLLSDVKVGCQLSGGIDSTLVTTYARDFFDANLDTFSIVFEDQKFSEEKWINQVVNKTKSDSHRYMFDVNYVINNIQSASWHLDLPINLPNTLGIKKLAEQSKQNATVLLSGEGADELMGGYNRFFDQLFRIHNNNKLRILSKFGKFGKKLSSKYMLDSNMDEYLVLSNSAISLNQYKKIRPQANINAVIAQRKELIPDVSDPVKRAIIYELRTHLVDLLKRQDKMTMAHSMENRVPFLDRNLVDFVLSLPSDLLVKTTSNLLNYNKPNGFTKHILKKLTVNKYGEEFTYRLKSGFPMPLSVYFKNRPLVDLMKTKIIPSAKKRNVFDEKFTANIFNKTNKSKSELKILWMILSFELWAQTFIDKK